MAKTFDKALIRSEFSKAWKSEKMVDFCTNEVSNVAFLPNGGIIPINKQSIKKRFCFGESGYDIDDAIDMAHHARTSADYFKAENMASFNGYVKDLQDVLNGVESNYYRYKVVIFDIAYSGQAKDCRLRSLGWYRANQIIDALGGSCYWDRINGEKIRIDGRDGHIATDEEICIILDAYKTARSAHEKRVDTYLKKYGLSQVRSWTYWRDA